MNIGGGENNIKKKNKKNAKYNNTPFLQTVSKDFDLNSHNL